MRRWLSMSLALLVVAACSSAVVNDNRSVQVGFTIELSPMGEPTCHAAARLAPVADGRIPRPAAT